MILHDGFGLFVALSVPPAAEEQGIRTGEKQAVAVSCLTPAQRRANDPRDPPCFVRDIVGGPVVRRDPGQYVRGLSPYPTDVLCAVVALDHYDRARCVYSSRHGLRRCR